MNFVLIINQRLYSICGSGKIRTWRHMYCDETMIRNASLWQCWIPVTTRVLGKPTRVLTSQKCIVISLCLAFCNSGSDKAVAAMYSPDCNCCCCTVIRSARCFIIAAAQTAHSVRVLWPASREWCQCSRVHTTFASCHLVAVHRRTTHTDGAGSSGWKSVASIPVWQTICYSASSSGALVLHTCNVGTSRAYLQPWWTIYAPEPCTSRTADTCCTCIG